MVGTGGSPEHGKVAKQLRESEENYKAIFEHIIDVYYRSNMDGKLVMLSPSGKDLLGYDSVEEMIGMDIASEFYYDPEDRIAFIEALKKKGEVRNYRGALKHKKGHPVFIETNSHFVFDKDGNPVGIEGIIRDITDHLKADQAIKESEEKYKRLFDHSNDAIFIHDLQGNISDVNQRACEMLGYTYDEMPKILIPELHPEEERGKSLQMFKKIHKEKAVRFESVFQRKDGFCFDVDISARIVDEETGVIEGMVRDISERKKAEREQRELEARLHRARKMEALGTLAGGVAHDLNNILWSMVSYPDLILSRLPEGSPLREPVTLIQNGGQKAVLIVQDLLALARSGMTVTEVMQVNDLINDYLKSVEYRDLVNQHKGLNVEVNLESDLPNILGSSVSVSKAVMNLVLNAAESMVDKGTIKIESEARTLDEPVAGYEEIRPGEYVVIRISDQGEGISPESIDRIFEPFYTTKVMGRSGTGLGMAVVWASIKDHNGFIDIKSAKDEGAVFELYFPATWKTQGHAERTGTLEEVKGNGEHILVVDDIPEQRTLIYDMLVALNYTAVTVATGKEAVEYVKNQDADLLLLDMVLNSEMNGIETYMEIRKLNPDQKVVIGSGYSEPEDIERAQEMGITGFVGKPYTLQKLGSAIKTALRT
jgi:PAS domain S-box-containing protein